MSSTSWSIFCVLVAGVLPLVCAGVAKWGFKDYDNHEPRAWLARQTGFRARGNAAQANSFEAFPFFAAGMLLALLFKVDAGTTAVLGSVFVAARIAYIASYVADLATLRSLCWTVGYGSVLALFALAFRSA